MNANTHAQSHRPVHTYTQISTYTNRKPRMRYLAGCLAGCLAGVTWRAGVCWMHELLALCMCIIRVCSACACACLQQGKGETGRHVGMRLNSPAAVLMQVLVNRDIQLDLVPPSSPWCPGQLLQQSGTSI